MSLSLKGATGTVAKGIFPFCCLLYLPPLAQYSQNNRTQTACTEMIFNSSCRSKIKNIQKVCGVQKSLSTEAPAGGHLPRLGDAQRGELGWGTEDGTDVVNTRRWDRNRKQMGRDGGRLGREERRTWRGESPGIVLRGGY